jgi:hypothetical protein
VPVIRTAGLPSLSDFKDISINILEIDAGEYRPGRIDLSGINRLEPSFQLPYGRPLLVRPEGKQRGPSIKCVATA